MKSLEMALIESAPHLGMFIFDEYYRYRMMRGVLHNKNGYTPENSEGKTLYQIIPDSEWDILEKYYDRALSGESFSIKYESPIDNCVYHVDFLPIDHDGQRYGAGVVRDVTGVINAEKLLNTKKNKEDLSSLIGKYYQSVSALLIELADDKDLCEKVKSRARRIFNKTIGLQKVAGNVTYDFSRSDLDSLVLSAAKKAKSLLSMDLKGGLIQADAHSFVQSLFEIFKSIKTEGYIKTIDRDIEIVFSPPESLDDFLFDVSIAVMKAHGYKFTRETQGGVITYRFENK